MCLTNSNEDVKDGITQVLEEAKSVLEDVVPKLLKNQSNGNSGVIVHTNEKGIVKIEKIFNQTNKFDIK